MTDYAEYLTQIDRLRREIHDACKAGEWVKARKLAGKLEECSANFYNYCFRQAKGD